MTFVGFKKATIAVFDVDGKVISKHIIEGKQDEGATVSAEISGLAKEATKVHGSDIAYYISQKGTGDVTVNFGLLDLPEEVNDKILGYKVDSNGISYMGKDTDPPYCSVLMESSDLSGEKAMLSVFKGKFSREAINLETLTSESFEPGAEEYVFTAIENDREGEAKGQTVGKYVGSVEAAITSLTESTFPTAA